ncbi:hypothetical protein LXL04_033640 [Taraxacum kok-saghyz]
MKMQDFHKTNSYELTNHCVDTFKTHAISEPLAIAKIIIRKKENTKRAVIRVSRNMPPRTRNGSGGLGNSETLELIEMISAEVRLAVQELFPGLFAQMKAEILEVMEAKLAEVQAGAGNASQGQPRSCTYKDFSACQPPLFEGQKDPLVRFATNLLCHGAKDWWGVEVQSLTNDEVEDLTWEEFKVLFKKEYVPMVEIEKVTKEFLSME